MSLSVVLITYNEAEILEKTLNTIHDIADQIIVVDSFSTDNTKEIATQYPKLEFYEKTFEGYGAQKNWALQHVKQRWVLFIDADEVVNEECKKDIITQMKNDLHGVFEVKFNNIVLGKHLKYGGWGNVKRIRFFKHHQVRFSDDVVHEKMLCDVKPQLLKGAINHFTYKDIYHHIAKMNTYSGLMAQKKKEKNKTGIVLKIVFSPMFEFFNKYIIKMGFLDGITGFYAAKVNAYYTFLKYCKVYEKLL